MLIAKHSTAADQIAIATAMPTYSIGRDRGFALRLRFTIS
jgi:hypothetical protein